jgi:hypothetical protein
MPSPPLPPASFVVINVGHKINGVKLRGKKNLSFQAVNVNINHKIN